MSKYRVNARGKNLKNTAMSVFISRYSVFSVFLNIESVSISDFLNIAISVSVSINRPTSMPTVWSSKPNSETNAGFELTRPRLNHH